MDSVRNLRGVGAKRAEILESKGINTVYDLIFFFPRAYEDRSSFSEISDLHTKGDVCIRAHVSGPVKEARIRKNFTVYKMKVFDDSGELEVVWYNNRFVKNAFRTGEDVVFYGKVVFSGKKKQLINPIYETAEKQRFIGKIMPIYPLFGNMTQKMMQALVEEAIKYVGEIKECIPKKIRIKYDIADINDAVRDMHFPKDFHSCQRARKRFVFEELFFLQLALSGKKANNEKIRTQPFADANYEEFIRKLPFALTNAQKRVTDEIAKDLKSDIPMNRLVQGDVGSGKTVVAAAAIYLAQKNGFQAAIMAPTEILAKQHFETFSEFFKGFGINIALLTGSVKNKQEIYRKVNAGEIDVVIGTNAIIQQAISYHNLGLIVTDEQHRFGVSQRSKLALKGDNPHTLVMTATPIPRTLSLILYGDLDISIIDELPPGRKKVLTYAVGENMRNRIYDFLRKNINDGSQAYIVCPLVSETEKNDLADAENTYKAVRSRFPDLGVGLIHGRMNSDEKDSVMRSFLENKIQILVSTTVIEVGVNVPRSNIMLIENAERFGLSTLHQLRGRVGRGAQQAYCIMIVNSATEVTRKRMETMCSSNDGFYISEQDLKLRGPGDFFGTRQHGLPEMKIANLFTDRDILEIAQKAVKEIFDEKISLSEEEYSELRKKVDKILINHIVFN